MKKIGLLIIAIFLLIGCGEIDKKEVSKENFKRVLNDYYSRDCIGIDLSSSLPMYEEINSKGTIDEEYLDLEKLGLIKLSDAEFDINKERKKRGSMSFFDDLSKVKMVKGKKIELTEKGKKIYQQLDNRYAKARLCLANYKVKTITNYTKPKDFMGMTIAHVEYIASPTNIVPYINDIAQIKRFSYFKERTTKDISTKADLILTEMKGWIHQREFKR